MSPACPSDLALEAYLLEPERSKLSPHLDGCEGCRGRLARMRAEGDEFRQFVFPATVGAIEEAVKPRRSRLAAWFAPVGALAALAAAALVVVRIAPGGPPPGYTGLKGGGVGLGVYVNEPGGARLVEDGATVPASGALRFEVKPGAACRLWIVSVDAKGEVSRLYPPQGDATAPRHDGPVPGGAVLDGQPGPERLFALCGRDATTWDEVRRAAAAAAGGPDAVRHARALGAPLADAPQSTLLLEKRP